MTEFKTQEAIEYIRSVLTSFRHVVPAQFMDDVENALNKHDSLRPNMKSASCASNTSKEEKE